MAANLNRCYRRMQFVRSLANTQQWDEFDPMKLYERRKEIDEHQRARLIIERLA
jgi:hypothetical protein